MWYYLDVKRDSKNTAGAKAPQDVAQICKDMGMTPFFMPVFPTNRNKFYQKIWLFTVCAGNWLRLKNKMKKGNGLVYQHPIYGVRVIEKMIPRIQKKGCRCIAVIHDLESLRKGIAGVIRQNEKRNDLSDHLLLSHFDRIICHNEHMRQHLISQGFRPEQLVNLEIFDYLTPGKQSPSAPEKTLSVAIAGNLAPGKCAYIYQIFGSENQENPRLQVHLFGSRFDETARQKNLIYHGSFAPEELPQHLEGSFGLVWDGNSAETCAGNTGEYLRYNNPHKTSLYLASGLPVIVWAQSAIKDFVLSHGVGITVDSLFDLEKTIAGVSNEDYQNMCQNVAVVGEQLRSGHYLRTALTQCIQEDTAEYPG